MDDPHRSSDDYDNPYRSPAAPLEGPTEPEPRPPADTTFGDARAQRAWRAAVVGLLVFPPLLNLYSAWILLELAFRDHPLSSAGSNRYIVAWLVNILACLVAGMLVVPGISFFWR